MFCFECKLKIELVKTSKVIFGNSLLERVIMNNIEFRIATFNDNKTFEPS